MTNNPFLTSYFGLDRKAAVVTGASSGLGREIARVLAHAGARVLTVGRRRERLEELSQSDPKLSNNLVSYAIDLNQEEAAQKVARECESKLGGCDILIACAAVSEYGAIDKFDRKVFDETLLMNVTRQAELCSALLGQLKKSEAGRVVHLSSIYGIGGPVLGPLAAYAASKHAVVGLMRAQAIEWAEFGITVNAVAPGHFPTEMTTETFEDSERAAFLSSRYPIKRLARIEEIGSAVLFLVSPMSSFVTGALIPVDGGWSCW